MKRKPENKEKKIIKNNQEIQKEYLIYQVFKIIKKKMNLNLKQKIMKIKNQKKQAIEKDINKANTKKDKIGESADSEKSVMSKEEREYWLN